MRVYQTNITLSNVCRPNINVRLPINNVSLISNNISLQSINFGPLDFNAQNTKATSIIALKKGISKSFSS